MQKWTDLLTPSAAALAILFAIALTIQSIRHGRAVKRLEARVSEREGAGARVPLDRLRELQKRGRTSSGEAAAAVDAGTSRPRVRRSGPNLAPVAAILAVLAVVAGTTWYLFFRGDGSNTAGGNQVTSTSTVDGGSTSTFKPVPPDQIRTTPSATPKVLPGGKGAYTVMVQNGSGVNGVAANVTPRVAGFGYATTQPTNATTQDIKQSFVVYVDASKFDVADNVAHDLGIKRLEPPDGVDLGPGTDGVDAVVVVGNDELAANYKP